MDVLLKGRRFYVSNHFLELILVFYECWWMRRRTDVAIAVKQACNLRFSWCSHIDDKNMKWRFADTNFTSSRRKMGHRHLIKIFTSFRLRSSVIPKKKKTSGEIPGIITPKGSQICISQSERGRQRGECFKKIVQTSIKDSLLHHLFPPLVPFAMATEYW